MENDLRDAKWWKKLAAVMELQQPVHDAIQADRPLLSQCSTIWSTLTDHAEAWHKKYSKEVSDAFASGVVNCFKKRAETHYHAAMPAAYLLDPINFVEPAHHKGQLRPPFKNLSETERADVVATVARVTKSSQEAVEAELLELETSKWSEDMLRKARAGMKRTEVTKAGGHTAVGAASVVIRRAFWLDTAAEKYPILATAADRLLSVHVTTAAAERNWSAWGRVYQANRNQLGIDKAEKLVYVKANYADSDDEDEEEQHEVIALDFVDF